MKKKFGARTILIPLLAVFLFYAIQLLISTVYIIVFAILKSANSVQMSFDQIFDETMTILFEHSNVIMIISSVLTIAVSLVFILLLKKNNKNAIRTKKVSANVWLASFLSVLGLGGVVFLQLAGLALIGEQIPQIGQLLTEYNEMSELFVVSRNIFLIIISTCILVPIAEELVFRGIIQGEFSRAMPPVLAVILQALIFALIHGNVIQISYVILPALLLGAIYHWTKSIYVPIVLHMVFNFFGSAVPLLLENNEIALTFFMLTLFAMIPVGVFALLYVFSKRDKDEIIQSEPITEYVPVQEENQYNLDLNENKTWKHKDV